MSAGTDSAASPARTGGRRWDSIWLTGPALAFVAVVFVAPLVVFGIYSLLTSELFSIGPPFTLSNYTDALGDSTVRDLARNSAVVGVAVAVVTVALGLPVAYWLRFSAGRWRMPVLFLITITVVASYLVRIYAWRSILGTKGLINSTLESIGVIDRPLDFLVFNRFAVGVALVHIFLPYVVLLLYASFNAMSPALLDCAQDLGAGAVRRWTRVILPLMAAPIASAFMLVLILSAGDYVTPQLLGGTTGVMLGVDIQNQFKSVGDYGAGAALSFLMMGAFLLLYALIALGLRATHLNDELEWTS